MTTQELRPAGLARPPLPVRAGDVLASEWIKVRSARSTYWALLIAAVLAVGLSALDAYLYTTLPPRAGGHLPHLDPLTLSFGGFPTAQLGVGVLGVLAFTSEHATGLIRTTFTAEPRRWAVLAAKAAVLGAMALVTGEVLAFASFWLTQAILSSHHLGISLSHPGALGAVPAAGIYLAVVALLGLGFGVIIRHTGAAIAVLIALAYVIPTILSLLPSPWDGRIGRFFPLTAAEQLVTLHPKTDMFSPALSMLVILIWAAAALLAAAVVISRRDA